MAYPGAVQDILDAQLIILGPGSLYTSILPNLLVPGIHDAIKTSHALKIYVCNVATQSGETRQYTAADHLEALLRHTDGGIVDIMLVNNNIAPIEDNGGSVMPVLCDTNLVGCIPVISGDAVNTGYRIHHDSRKLARLIFKIYDQRKRRMNKVS